MGTNQTSLKEKENLIKYSQDQLDKAVDWFVSNNEARLVAKTLGDLLFYATNPNAAKELEKDDIVALSLTAINLLTDMLGVYERYSDLCQHEKKEVV